jgi:translocator protein
MHKIKHQGGIFMYGKIKLKPLLISILIALLAGAIGGFLGNSSAGYANLIKPEFSPPAALFPIVWTILYILMGISAYIIYISDSKEKTKALTLYAAQLIVNSLWTFFFFNLGWILFSFIWLLFLLILVIATACQFYKISPLAAYLLIPYIIWLIFAAILNYSIFLLNGVKV